VKRRAAFNRLFALMEADLLGRVFASGAGGGPIEEGGGAISRTGCVNHG